MNETVPLEQEVRPLPLDAWHRARGARMVPFAGYSMPIQYEGIVTEHEWTREHAGLFDVSHMGQIIISGPGATKALEALLPANLAILKPGRIRYSLLLADNGGILDDLMITNVGTGDDETFYLVVNGATKHDDITHIRAHLPESLSFTYMMDRALLALQGPEAAAVLDGLFPGISGELSFMQSTSRTWNGAAIGIGRSGYTGEDGFEISLPATIAEEFATALLADERVKPIGLGARDSLRLEAGLPLYGHDLDTVTDPVSADLTFALSKQRREEGGFPGAERIAQLLADGPPAKRVGLEFEGRLPAREGAAVFAGDNEVGTVTSGGFAPTLGRPIAMAYVDIAHTEPGATLSVQVRNRRLDAKVVPMPFVPHRYYRAGAGK
ncbi:aminomethyltransferase [Altererythrobacter atlanticus]|uniref:aminomethyltransferase n=1 Tax=Croceibacterium atlanticum TaxID=1267766 RepID=A0A0F7KXA6_9SPHN|nr:glycine cleavage system aminomethyltransferase GcvT [Croceibacterium atlanticum]AKH43851.1 Aminomethyltransferase [Croceibacterium atlanticum]MBB5733699.1 aminomethyltransferase [Croceibacterium atlanticum]